MEYKPFKDIQLSRLGMGNMRLPTDGEGFNAPINYEKAHEIIDYGMAHGMTIKEGSSSAGHYNQPNGKGSEK